MALGPALLTPLQEFKYFVVNTIHLGGEVLVGQLRSTVADNDIAVGSRADRCLLSGGKTDIPFQGRQDRF
jgi:hypothetical protein